MSCLLGISIIYELTSISIDFALFFTQVYLEFYVFVYLPLRMIFDGNRG